MCLKSSKTLGIHTFCNSEIDCTNEMDEAYCEHISIVPAFRCPKEKRQMFVDYREVGDTHIHCPLSLDDELLMFSNYHCKKTSCVCKGFAVWCHNTVKLPVLNMWTKSLVITNDGSDVAMTAISIMLTPMKYLIILKISIGCTYIPEHLLSHLHHITRLDLSLNKISKLFQNSFKGLHVLHSLNLSHNSLTSIPKDLLHDLKMLVTLDISHNPYTPNNIPETLLNSALHLTKLYVVHESICCLKARIQCFSHIKTDIIGTCHNILAFSWLKVGIILFIILITMANAACFALWKYDSRGAWKAKHVLGCNLNAADSLMSIYLIIIMIMDSIFHKDIAYVALKWKLSAQCLLAGATCLFSIEMSIIFNLMIAVDRFICIVIRPFSKKGMTLKASLVVSASLWVVMLAIFSLTFVFARPQLTNSVCIIIGSSLPFSHSLMQFDIQCNVCSLHYLNMLCWKNQCKERVETYE